MMTKLLLNVLNLQLDKHYARLTSHEEHHKKMEFRNGVKKNSQPLFTGNFF